jgi:hypothetical protein
MQKRLLAIGSAAILAASIALPAVAAPPANEGNSQPTGKMAPPASNTHVSQAKLKRFAATYQEVTQLRNKYSQKMQSAKGKKDAQAIAQKARKKMKAAIRDHGFTIESYTKVVKAVNSNKQLQKRFMKLTGQTGKSS